MSSNQKSTYSPNEYESGPRPPVPGKESRKMTEYGGGGGGSGGGGDTASTGSISAAISLSSLAMMPSATVQQQQQQPSPLLPSSSAQSTMSAVSYDYCARTTPPSYFKWHQSLYALLEDPEGVELFNRYVKSEGSEHSDRLNFYFACEGLKQKSDYEEIKRTVEAIYKFVRRSRLTLSNDLRRLIKAGLKNELILTSHIYDGMQHEIIRIINDTTYPSFLQSELYIQYVAQVQSSSAAGQGLGLGSGVAQQLTASGDSCSSNSNNSSSSSSTQERLVQCSSMLPTLHEDTELLIANSGQTAAAALGPSSSASLSGECHTPSEIPMRLTKDLLLATQRRRLDVRPPGAIGYSVYNATYSSSYNPVSRQDSELQSCSSGGRTDSDKLSTSRDGRSHHHQHHPSSQHRQQSTGVDSKTMKQNALLNKETNTFAVIPRTQRIGSSENWPLKTEELLSKVIPKLEQYKKEQDINEKLRRRLQDTTDTGSELSARLGAVVQQQRYPGQGQADLTEAILRKLPPVDDNDQSILDEHVSRVWSDLTPHLSPGTISPCPFIGRRRTCDSGISAADSASTLGSQSMRHSKSMPEHSGGGTVSSTSSRKLTNKWPSMNTDSGISLFSADATLKSRENSCRSRTIGMETAAASTAFQLEEARRRLEDESRRSRRYSQHPLQQIPPATATAAGSSSSSSSTTTSQQQQQQHQQTLSLSHFHGICVPTTTATMSMSMPPLLPPPPLSASSLSMLQQQQQQQQQSEFPPLHTVQYPSMSRTNINYNQPPQLLLAGPPPPPLPSSCESTTIAVYTFCDEDLPYRSKLPGVQPTLKQFKDYLPKKGSFRFFFKTACEDPDNPIIQEEITNDNEILPLFEGKVMGLVKPFE